MDYYWGDFKSTVEMIIGYLLILGLYFIPSIVAGLRRHKNWLAIGFTNFFFGWTGVGWVITLIWSVKK